MLFTPYIQYTGWFLDKVLILVQRRINCKYKNKLLHFHVCSLYCLTYTTCATLTSNLSPCVRENTPAAQNLWKTGEIMDVSWRGSSLYNRITSVLRFESTGDFCCMSLLLACCQHFLSLSAVKSFKECKIPREKIFQRIGSHADMHKNEVTSYCT